MTLAEAIKEAAREQNPQKANEVAEFMSARLGVNYDGMMKVVEKAGVRPQEWEGLLYEAWD